MSYPRVLAAAWFGACGFVAGALCLFMLMVFFSIVEWKTLLLSVISGGVGACIGGALFGARILQVPLTPGRSALQGVIVVAASYVPCAVLLNLLFEQSVSLPFVLLCAWGCLLATGIVTFPAGASAGWYLAVYRDHLARPRGCKLHGYGKPRR